MELDRSSEYNAISSAKEARKALVKDKIIAEDKRLLCIDDLVSVGKDFGTEENQVIMKLKYNGYSVF